MRWTKGYPDSNLDRLTSSQTTITKMDITNQVRAIGDGFYEIPGLRKWELIEQSDGEVLFFGIGPKQDAIIVT